MKCGSRHGNYYIMWKLKSQHESTVKLRKMFDLHKNSFQTPGIFSQQNYIFVLTFSVFLWYNNYIPKYTENQGAFSKTLVYNTRKAKCNSNYRKRQGEHAWPPCRNLQWCITSWLHIKSKYLLLGCDRNLHAGKPANREYHSLSQEKSRTLVISNCRGIDLFVWKRKPYNLYIRHILGRSLYIVKRWRTWVINCMRVVLLVLIWNGISDSERIWIKIILMVALILVFGLAVSLAG